MGLLNTGSAFYAPSASAVDMVEAIMKDQKRCCPVRFSARASMD